MEDRHIQVLDDLTANAIAAGEVIERPASVVKELIENSLDAAATKIDIQVNGGGISELRISDNGKGFLPGDVPLAFLRHATSKLSAIEDLDSLRTMGFRGEALSSIAAISNLTLYTRRKDEETGLKYEVSAGDIMRFQEYATAYGTTIIVRDLFFNTPARYKFLRKDYVEANAVVDVVTKIALAHPEVAFSVTKDGQECLRSPGNGSMFDTVYAVWGKAYADMMPLAYKNNNYAVTGYLGTPNNVRKNRSKQLIFVNGRLIQSKMLLVAIEEGCKTWFMRGAYPPALIFLQMPINLVDVNVSPQKTEVRFVDERISFSVVHHAVRDALLEYAANLTSIPETPSVTQLTSETNTQNIPLQQQSFPELSQTIGSHWHTNLSFGEANNPIMSSQQPEHPIEPIGKLGFSETELVIWSKMTKIETELVINQLLDARYIGQLFDTFIMLEHNEQLLLIDQHAAHERILYEELKEKRLKAGNNQVPSQLLLEPIVQKLEDSDMEVLLEQAEFVKQVGFLVEPFSPQGVLIRGVPSGDKASLDAAKALLVLLDLLAVRKKSEDPLDLDELDHHLACKAAIKANHSLDNFEIRQIIEDLGKLENPYHCPHGRPTIIRIDRREIDKKFKRIV